MTDRPIIFSAPMVRALLAGQKTQTRRVLKSQPPHKEDFFGSDFGLSRAVADGVKFYSQNDYGRLPKHPTKWDLVGSVGVARNAGFPMQYDARFGVDDRLWVRETVACGACALGKPSLWSPSFWRREQGTPENPNGIWYAADQLAPAAPITERGRWVPAIHMPRWCSRLTLVVADVKVERLQDISEADAKAEGVDAISMADVRRQAAWSARGDFAQLWNNINGPNAWDENPYVVAVSFDVTKANIDRLNPHHRPLLEERGASSHPRNPRETHEARNLDGPDPSSSRDHLGADREAAVTDHLRTEPAERTETGND